MAHTTPQVPASVDVLPPADPKAMLRIAIVGAAVCGLAALLALAGDVSMVHRLRLFLVAGGMLAAAIALTRRPGDSALWLLSTATLLLAWIGLPEHWDSARLVVRMMALAAAIGWLLVVDARLRYAALSAFVLFHFGNMVTATTLPESRPWVSGQLFSRVYMPYMRFMYLGNAYHFYSPEPGPSSYLFCLITWETDVPDTNADGSPKRNPDGSPVLKMESAWVELPRRDLHYKDPLGLGYYRRLSITELVAGSVPGNLTPDTFEKNEAVVRRREVAARPNNQIPLVADADPIVMQYRVPRQDIIDRLFPSYARHIASEYSRPGARVVRMKLYRVEHRVIGARDFLTEDEKGNTVSPYSPLLYRPYFLGEYSPEGVLLNPRDPMLYWLTPILRSGVTEDGKPVYIDYMSLHAGFEYFWRERS